MKLLSLGGIPEIPSNPGLAMFEMETLNYMALTSLTRTAAEAINNNIKTVKAGGSVSLSSQTMNLSTVNGLALIANPLTDLRPYLGYKATITAGGKTLVGWIKAAGTGETYDTEKISNGSFTTDTTGWTANGTTIASVASGQSGNCLEVTRAAGDQQGVYQQVTGLSVGGLYYFYVYTKSGTSGNESFKCGVDTTDVIAWPQGFVATGTTAASWVKSSLYFSATSTSTYVALNKNSATAGTMLFDTASLRKVLIPSAGGVTIVSESGGTTPNWASNDGIDANAASFTIAITRA